MMAYLSAESRFIHTIFKCFNTTVMRCWYLIIKSKKVQSDTKGGFPVLAEITRMLAENTPKQLLFVIITTASTRCLVENLLFAVGQCQVTVRQQWKFKFSNG